MMRLSLSKLSLRAYLSLDHLDDARRMMGARSRGSSRIPIFGLAALH
jgi:hypothetical protein